MAKRPMTEFYEGGKAGGESWAPPPAEPPGPGTPDVLHVDEERRRAAAGGHLALTLLGNFARLLALLAPHRERQGAQPLLSDFVAALEAIAVVALLQARERVVDLVQRLRLHLDQRELDLVLDVGLGALDGVEHLVLLAGAPAALGANIAHLTLHLGL